MSVEQLNEFAQLFESSTDEDLKTDDTNQETDEDIEDEGDETEDEGDLTEDDDGQSDDSDDQDDDESLDQEPSDTDDDSDEEYFPETLGDLVEAYDGDETKLRGVSVSSKKNGEKVTLGQVLDYWDTGESVNRKSQELSAKLKEVDEEKTKIHSTMHKRLDEQTAIIEALEKVYKDQGKEVLEQLRQTDPAEYAVKRMEFSDRDNALAQIKANVDAKRTELMEEQQKEYLEKLSEFMAAENQKVAGLIPEWKDEKVFNKDYPEIQGYLGGLGFTDEELSVPVDAKTRRVIRDAMLYNRIKTKAEPAKKRVVKKPRKVVRAGKLGGKNPKGEALKKRMKAAAVSTNRRVKSNVIADLLLNGE